MIVEIYGRSLGIGLRNDANAILLVPHGLTFCQNLQDCLPQVLATIKLSRAFYDI